MTALFLLDTRTNVHFNIINANIIMLNIIVSIILYTHRAPGR